MPAFLVGVAIALLAAASATAEPPAISAKRVEAEQVLAQVHQMDSRLEHAVESYNLANVKLDGIKGDLRTNSRHLALARKNLRRTQRVLARRLIALYTSGEGGSTVEVLLGAQSLDDLLSRMETVNRVSDQDAGVAREVKRYRTEVRKRQAALRRAKRSQTKVVADRATQKSSIERQLSERQSALSSIRGEIVRLEAEERARQLLLQQQARARLAAQQRARAAAAAERRLAASTAQSADSSSEATAPQALSVDGADDSTDLPAQDEPVPAPVEDPIATSAAEASAAPAPEETAATAPAAAHGGVVGIAMQYLGVPYRWGGADPSGFDCSGFSMYVFAQIGVSLPHNAAAQYGMGTPISQSELQPGDLVFFDGLGHMGIYIGGGQFVHAPHTGDVVKISSLSDSWYAQTYVGARRV